MATTETAKRQTAEKAQGQNNAPATTTQSGGDKPAVYTLLEQFKPQLERALPSFMNADRFARVAWTSIRNTPKLMQCDPASLLGALVMSAQLGLEPGPLGHAYLVPFYNNKKRQHECQWILGYTGIIDLARRSGHIEVLMARPVYENDHFVVRYGLDDTIEHTPALGQDRGELLYTYSFAKFVGGGHSFIVCDREDIEKARQHSQTGRKNEGPWRDHFEAMAVKTPIRRLRPFLPLSVEMRDAFAADEQRLEWTADEDVIDIAGDHADEAELEAGSQEPDAEPEPEEPASAAQESGQQPLEAGQEQSS